MKMNIDEKYWDRRAESYNNLEWVKNSIHLKEIINAVNPKKGDLILDVGTGTGVVASVLAPFAKMVIGIDISQKMLNKAEHHENIYYLKLDARESFFQDNMFSKIVARQIIHHLHGTDAQYAIDLCYKALRLRGHLIIAEPVCPAENIKDEYNEIFKLKDNRQMFTIENLIEMLCEAGFQKIKASTFKVNKFSVKNWLSNNALSPEIQNKIFEFHVTASNSFKKAFNMKIINGDCLISVKNSIVLGEKKEWRKR